MFRIPLRVSDLAVLMALLSLLCGVNDTAEFDTLEPKTQWNFLHMRIPPQIKTICEIIQNVN